MSWPLVTLALAAAAAGPEVEVGQGADGLSLVAVTVPSPRCEVRVVVRAGARLDPQGKAGLAHLLEHVVFDGPTGTTLLATGERTVNAFTSASSTVFVLSAPADACQARLELLLRMLSEGRLDPAWLTHEKAVVLREQVARRGHLDGFLENALFPTVHVIGSEASRRDVTPEDLARFFREHYTPSNLVLLTVGPLRLAELREAVDHAFFLPPELPSERRAAAAPPLPAGPPDRAVFGENPGDFSGITGLAAEVPPAQVRLCQAAGALLQLRVAGRLGLDGGFAGCQLVHGRLLLVLGTQVGSAELKVLDYAQLVLNKLRQLANELRTQQAKFERLPDTPQTRAARAQLQARVGVVLQVAVAQQDLVEKLEALVKRRKDELKARTAVLDQLWGKTVAAPDAAERKLLQRRQAPALSWAADEPSLLADLLDDVVAWSPPADLLGAVQAWTDADALDERTLRGVPAFLTGLERLRLTGQ